MKYSPMTRYERRGEDPREADSLRKEIGRQIADMDPRTLQQVLWYIEKKKG